MTALALREDQTIWDADQLAVLHSTGIDEDVTEAELKAYLHECQRLWLDPFTRQIYLLGRWDYQKQRKVYRSQTSIDGFRLIARRAADEAHETIEYEDSLWCGPDGKWVDVWLAAEPPAACKLTVLRGGKRFPAVARYSGYVQLNKRNEPTGQWAKMADNQIAKCAEALALRKAFPEELGSLYTDDEMAQADNPQTIHATAEVVPPPQQDPEGSQQVVDDASVQAAVLADREAATVLWSAVAEMLKAGRISKPQADLIGNLIKARVADLEHEDTQVVEGVVISGLDPEDPWHDKVQSVASGEDAEAAIADVKAGVKAKSMTTAKADQVIAAIRAREASLVAA